MIDKIVEKIKKSQNILIAGHVMPDGDAIGAAISLYYIIKKYDENKNVVVFFNDDMPGYMDHFNKDVKIFNKIDFDVDLLISVDTANIERLAVDEDIIKNAKDKCIIDHHISNTKYFDTYYVKQISSASEMIYDFLEKLDVSLDENISRYMYLGIVNDTGCFRHSNVTPSTFMIASKLLETGIDSNYVYRTIFDKTRNKAEVFSKAIVNGVYDADKKFMYYYITKDEIEKNGYSKGDMEGASEYMLSITDVEVSLFMYDTQDGHVKGSFRSKFYVDVNSLAKNFNGGGHIKAAGFKTNMKKDDIIKKIMEVL